MRQFVITEAQLDELQVLVWGARMTKPGEPERFNQLVAEVKKQLLVPAEKMRKAFQDNFVQTQDQLQRGLLKQHQTQPPAVE